MKIAINGFGRIGRQVFKIIKDKYKDIEIVAVNDLTDTETLAYLLKYDSNYGRNAQKIVASKKGIIVNGDEVRVLSQTDPKKLPWRKLKVDVVIEATGRFTDAKDAKAHIRAGAKKVIITAPAKNHDITIVMGVNDEKYDSKKHRIISNASCTTNSLAPMVKVLLDNFGIKKALMTTVHSYTNDQRILDLPHKDLHRARAAALNIIPTTTGAAKAIAKVIPELEGKIDGMAMRIPTPAVSITDLVVETEKDVTVDEVNGVFGKAINGKMKGIMGISNEPLVSMDFKGDERSSIIAADHTKVVGGNLVKVLSWYDNEWGYSSRTADLVKKICKEM